MTGIGFEEGGAGRRGRLRVLSVVIPLVGLAVLYPLRLLLARVWPPLAVETVLGAVVIAGIIGFSWAVFRVINRQDRHLALQHEELARRLELERRLRAQLEALHQAALAIASAGTSAQILQRLVDLARDLIGARYAALGVIGPHGAIDAYYTAGVSDEQRARLESTPHGHGLLSALTTQEGARDGQPGAPLRRPPLLSVPVAHGRHVVGALYLADKTEAAEFSAGDKHLLTLLAGHAAVVIENARLADQVRRLAIVSERDRISRDLHDGVIQAIYAVNLELEDATEDLATNPTAVRQRLDMVIDRLGEVMKDIRRYILRLQPDGTASQPLHTALATMLAEAHAHTLMETDLRVDSSACAGLPAALAQELAHIAREAIANVVRHAKASRLWVTLELVEGAAHLCVGDNGVGFDAGAGQPVGHYGLANLRQRAASLGGQVTVHSSPGQWATVDVWAPLAAPEREETHA